MPGNPQDFHFVPTMEQVRRELWTDYYIRKQDDLDNKNREMSQFRRYVSTGIVPDGAATLTIFVISSEHTLLSIVRVENALSGGARLSPTCVLFHSSCFPFLSRNLFSL
jgi:hypothetical protein